MKNDISQIIELADEFRNVEFKQGASWNDLKYKITKCILAMSNIKDGGTILIGMEREDDKGYIAEGVSESDLESYQDKDAIKEFVANYADPYVNFEIEVEEFHKKKFIKINVSEFEELPVICKKPYPSVMKEGSIYTRSKGNKPETIEIPSHIEMREVIEMAIDKGNRKLTERGYTMKLVKQTEQLFDEQSEDFK